jgi:hypothetical protein
VEAEGELLVDGAVRVDQDVGWVTVDAGEPGELDGDAGLFGDFTSNGVAGGFANLDTASGQLPVTVVDPTDE